MGIIPYDDTAYWLIKDAVGNYRVAPLRDSTVDHSVRMPAALPDLPSKTKPFPVRALCQRWQAIGLITQGNHQ